jgi:2-methylisocitrate lyase-like PEP mutase family enzyme
VKQPSSGIRALIGRGKPLITPGVADALNARLVEDLGFEAVYLTGAGLSNTRLGMPDLGLLSVTELVETASRITDVCALPLIVDIDTGFGNALNTYRTVRMVEKAGAAALQLEDQVFPKKCGHFSGKAIIPLPEMLGKLNAALDARQSPELQIIARTDARAIDGLEAALDRARAFIEAGADITFVEAPISVEELNRIAELPAPQVVNIVVGGKTPMLELDELSEFAIVLYANAVLQAAIHSTRDILGHLRRNGSLRGHEHLMANFEERQQAVGKPFYDALEAKYARE